MFREKQSFFKKMVSVINSDYDDEESGFEEEENPKVKVVAEKAEDDDWNEEDSSEGQLTIDMHQTPKEITIHTMVAGVKPEDLDVSINREMVVVKGKRIRSKKGGSEDALFEELYWGAFSRTIVLPEEVEVEDAEAGVQNGLLTITLPIIDRDKTQRLKIKSS